jgi:hypothetical protein
MSLPTEYNLLEYFPNEYFIETGSYRGDAIKAASDAGFKRIRSCDIDENNIQFCISRFNLKHQQDKNQLRLYVGDSALMLRDMIEDIIAPCTFWLDSHWQLFEHEPKGKNPFPLMLELMQIQQHSVKEHTILIDDILYMTHPQVTGWTLNDIKEAVRDINRNYKFKLISNPVVDNLLICSL